ncbi:MAG: hypothetical protein ACJ79R_03215 [Anaeromyxobacteraceae bacterium]
MRLAAAILSLLAPALALACPVCATDKGPNAALFIGAMIAAPYVVAAVVIRAIRGAGEEP